MPIVARCPKCNTELEVDDNTRPGAMVECPVCLTQFAPEIPEPPRKKSARDSYRHDRDDDDEHDDDDYDEDDELDRPSPSRNSRRRRRDRDDPLTIEEAREMLHAPAFWLQITGWGGAILSLLGGGAFAAIFAVELSQNQNNQGPNASDAIANIILGGLYAVFGTIYFAIIGFGATKMRRVESYNWSYATAILGILTIVLCGICLPTTWAGTGCGIWAITILSKPGVKEVFKKYDDDDDE